MLYVLDWCVYKNISVLSVLLYALDKYVVGVMYLLDCNVALCMVTVIQKPTLNDTKYSDYGCVCVTSFRVLHAVQRH